MLTEGNNKKHVDKWTVQIFFLSVRQLKTMIGPNIFDLVTVLIKHHFIRN
jgi:hypothetical protein